MSGDSISRRQVLKRAGAAGAGAMVATGGATAGKPPRRIVGTSARSGTRAATDRASSVRRTLEFGDIGQAVAGRFSDEAVESLRQRSDVRYVEADVTVHAIHHREGHGGGPGDGGGGGSTSQRLPWGVDRTDSEVAHANGETGAGADIAIIDSGIDDDHPDLQANVGAGKAFTKCKGPTCNYAWSDDNDHGTHCAGIADADDNDRGVVGVSTEATLHAVKVLDKRGSGSLSDVAAGIQYTADQGWDVASMSLGASSGAQTLKDACTYAADRGVLLVAAAGNSGPCTDCVGYPAAYSEVVAVASTASDDTLSSFSSTGPEVELAAPGTDIYSTVPGGYDTFSGTSMACPHVSGAGAQLMANGATASDARSQLKSTAESLGLGDSESGAGLLDTAAALGLDSSDD
ncbi:S8 family peptidase [Halorarius halobius]|uniref:S8 family peptidase n=1 Tax=Halorarius halobius TaxID=2962671 RepID=UPI0020CF95D6|nr:S8 family peptidase [Halorarius halobius]